MTVTTTIQITAELAGAIQESLLSARLELARELSAGRDRGLSAPGPEERLEELDGLLEQIGSQLAPAEGRRELTGSRGALWGAVYDALCKTAEALAEDCNEYWRGIIEPAELYARVGDLAARLDLLQSIGPPPGEDG